MSSPHEHTQSVHCCALHSGDIASVLPEHYTSIPLCRILFGLVRSSSTVEGLSGFRVLVHNIPEGEYPACRRRYFYPPLQAQAGRLRKDKQVLDKDELERLFQDPVFPKP